MTTPNGIPSTPVLATPGSPEYFQSVLNKVTETHPEFPLDPVILQSLLLCLVAGRYHESHGQCSQTHTRSKNLVLRTKEEDVGIVLNVVAMVSVLQCRLSIWELYCVVWIQGVSTDVCTGILV